MNYTLRCELPFSIAIAALCSDYTNHSGKYLLALGVTIQTIANYYFRKEDDSSWTPAFVFWGGTGYNGHILVHEAGHALAVKGLLKKPARIEIYPFQTGMTFFSKVETDTKRILISAAGPFASLAFSAMTLEMGLQIKEKHPETSRLLIVSSIINSMAQAIYAFQALFTPRQRSSHDFVVLWNGGIHPIVSAIVILAHPIIRLYGSALPTGS